MDPILVTILVAALVAMVTAIITPTISSLFRPFIRKTQLKMHQWTWKSRIPKGYVGADLMLQFKINSKIKVLGRDYEVIGLTEYSHRGERGFEFPIREADGKTERFLEFDGEKIFFWADLEDDNFWEYLGVNKINIPDSISLKFCEELLKKQTEPLITLVNNNNEEIQARFIGVGFGSNIENLFGGTTTTPVPYETDYNWVEAVIIEDMKKNSNYMKKDIYILFESYGAEEFFKYFSVGIRIKHEDIELKEQ